MEVKARRLAALGLPHYWLLDIETHRLECFRNDSGTMVLAGTGDGDEGVEASARSTSPRCGDSASAEGRAAQGGRRKCRAHSENLPPERLE